MNGNAGKCQLVLLILNLFENNNNAVSFYSAGYVEVLQYCQLLSNIM